MFIAVVLCLLITVLVIAVRIYLKMQKQARANDVSTDVDGSSEEYIEDFSPTPALANRAWVAPTLDVDTSPSKVEVQPEAPRKVSMADVSVGVNMPLLEPVIIHRAHIVERPAVIRPPQPEQDTAWPEAGSSQKTAATRPQQLLFHGARVMTNSIGAAMNELKDLNSSQRTPRTSLAGAPRLREQSPAIARLHAARTQMQVSVSSAYDAVEEAAVTSPFQNNTDLDDLIYDPAFISPGNVDHV